MRRLKSPFATGSGVAIGDSIVGAGLEVSGACVAAWLSAAILSASARSGYQEDDLIIPQLKRLQQREEQQDYCLLAEGQEILYQFQNSLELVYREYQHYYQHHLGQFFPYIKHMQNYIHLSSGSALLCYSREDDYARTGTGTIKRSD
jgi:predicted glycoside hydrolase/deacetylase ChbG (UPF0249 family)